MFLSVVGLRFRAAEDLACCLCWGLVEAEAAAAAASFLLLAAVEGILAAAAQRIAPKDTSFPLVMMPGSSPLSTKGGGSQSVPALVCSRRRCRVRPIVTPASLSVG